VISWDTPTDINYGTPLSGAQLNASAGGVPGTFVYTPSITTVLNAGNGQTLSVQFTPTATDNYNIPASKTVNINVQKVTPVISWDTPTDINYGTPLSGAQLNASAGGVPGNFVYTPSTNTVLNAGSGQTLSVQFTPTDTTDYKTPAPNTVNINVGHASLSITATNASKVYGQNLIFAGTEFTNGALVGSDTVTSVTLTSTGATNTAPVANSPYIITPSSAIGSGLGNYSITYNPGYLTVSNAVLTVTHSGNSVIISWPSASTGFVLQQNSNLATTNWTTSSGISDDGTNKSITITSLTGNLFFRLSHP